MIKLNNIEFSYGRNVVLSDFSLEIPKKNVVSILGHNGAGKTTIAKLIAGSLLPGKGSVYNGIEPKNIFFFSNKGNVYANMSLEENIKFLRMLKGINRDDTIINERVGYYLKRFKMNKHYGKKILELSSGLRTRAILISGLIFDPDMLLLDEPTNTVDPYTKKLIAELLNELSNQDKLIILITHDLDFCYEVSKVNIIIDNGQLLRMEEIDKECESIIAFKEKYLHYTEGGLNDESCNI